MLNVFNNGYDYATIRKQILISFHSHTDFPFNKYSKKVEQNLLTPGIMYYHKELKLMNALPVINQDIDKGTMTSSKIEYFLEPVASYTMDDLLRYFYSKEMTEIQEYNPKRMAGIFRHMIGKYGIDKLLFMIEASARMYNSEKRMFSLSDFDSYSSTASQYLEEIKNNCVYSGGNKYVPRKRVLFS